jgi:hypothetical protein
MANYSKQNKLMLDMMNYLTHYLQLNPKVHKEGIIHSIDTIREIYSRSLNKRDLILRIIQHKWITDENRILLLEIIFSNKKDYTKWLQ